MSINDYINLGCVVFAIIVIPIVINIWLGIRDDTK